MSIHPQGITEDLARLSDAARPGPWLAYETVQADSLIVKEGEGLFNGPGPIMGPSYDKTTVEYVVALVNAHRAGFLAALPETPRPQDISTDDALIYELHSTAEWLKRTRNYTDADRVMRAVAAFRRPSPLTESEVRKEAARQLDAIDEGAEQRGHPSFQDEPSAFLSGFREGAVWAAARVGGEQG